MADNYLEISTSNTGHAKQLGRKRKNPVRHKRYISRHFLSKKAERSVRYRGAGVLAKHCRSLLQA